MILSIILSNYLQSRGFEAKNNSKDFILLCPPYPIVSMVFLC